MKVCIIIPALNEEEFIGELIDSINLNSYKEKEIIVVDDGSDDKTVEIAKQKGAKVFVNSPGRMGPAFGFNFAAKKTDAEILCAVDADFYFSDKNFIKKAVDVFDEKTVAVYTSYKVFQDTLIEKICSNKQGISTDPLFIRRDVFLELGGYPLIGFSEDHLFTIKLKEYVKKNKLKEKILKNAYFSHHAVRTLSELYVQARWYGKNTIPFIKMWPKKPRFFGLSSVFLPPVYFISFIFSIFSFYNIFFSIFFVPFFYVILLTIYQYWKSKNIFVLGQIFTFLVFGLGMLHGLLIYLFWFDGKYGY